MKLEMRNKDDCTFDMISLGEIMLRFDPGDSRIRTARSFRVWEGGGEYNVARGLRKCFGLKTAAVTALADNEIGRLVDQIHKRQIQPRKQRAACQRHALVIRGLTRALHGRLRQRQRRALRK